MGFFFAQSAAEARQPKKGGAVIPIELMKDQGCIACPSNEVDRSRRTPKMEPAGSDRPVVYIIDQFPSDEEDSKDEVLLGDTGDLVYGCIPSRWRRQLRVGYAVRCRPLKGPPGQRESTCCSKHLEDDIARSRPQVVVGLGELPLRWALGGTGAPDSVWRGRMWPIKVRDHVCHYLQLQSPQFIVRTMRDSKGNRRDSVYERQLKMDMRALFTALDNDALGQPEFVVAPAAGIECFDGSHELHSDLVLSALEDMVSEPDVGIDIETNALRPYSNGSMIVTCAISTPTKTIAFPVEHPDGWDARMRPHIRRALMEFIQRSGNKVAHNLMFEMEWFGYHYGTELLRSSHWGDSMAAMHTLDERTGALGLGKVTRQLFGFDVKELTNIDSARIMQYPLRDVLPYNGLDAKWCLRSWLKMRPLIEAADALRDEYERKVRMTPALVRAQLRGLHADLEYTQRIHDTLEQEQESAWRILRRCREVVRFEKEVGREFTASDDDVVVLLRDVMKRDEGEREDGGYSGDESVLSSIPSSVSIAPEQILALRSVSKLMGTYTKPMLNRDPNKGSVVLHDDGLVHTIYNSMVAVTGRLSAEDPNVHNYPKRKRKEVRGMIVAPEGFVFGACDYGQIEARVIAMASRDRALVDAMWTNYDIHEFWAKRFVHHHPEIKDWIVAEFDVDWDEKGLKTLRQEAKNKWVFPMFFGSSFKSCAKSLHVPEHVAEAVRDEFWDTFAGVLVWQKKLIERYRQTMSVATLTGRLRRGPMSLNEIINTPIQGTAADIFKEAMCRCSERAELEDNPALEPPINLHDDLSFYWPRDTWKRDMEKVVRIMCEPRFDFINVPLVVEVSVSEKHWHDMKPVGIYRSDEMGYHAR